MQSFDVVFTKDAWLHVHGKPALLREVHRVLKPGGKLAGGDWMKGPEPFSADMLYFIELEGIPYHPATLAEYGIMLHEIGFEHVKLVDINAWYRDSPAGICPDKGELFGLMTEKLGIEARDHFLEDWRMLTVVLDKGELRPGRLWGESGMNAQTPSSRLSGLPFPMTRRASPRFMSSPGRKPMSDCCRKPRSTGNRCRPACAGGPGSCRKSAATAGPSWRSIRCPASSGSSAAATPRASCSGLRSRFRFSMCCNRICGAGLGRKLMHALAMRWRNTPRRRGALVAGQQQPARAFYEAVGGRLFAS